MYDAVILTGPTAVGKTALSLELAGEINAEIISMDSRLVYRGLDIGTAKPSMEERAAVPHHLIDVADPGERFTVADFVENASRTAADIRERGKIPLFIGGTCLYLHSLIGNYALGGQDFDPEVRAGLERQAADKGAAALHADLSEVDPSAAARIHPNDQRRIIRALEVFHVTGQTLSARNREAAAVPGPFANALLAGLCRPREILYNFINQRVESMYNNGLIEETRAVCERWPGAETFLFGVIGYSEALRCIREECSRDAAIALTQKATRAFAKRQITWFRRMRGLIWLNCDAVTVSSGVQLLKSAIN